MSVSSKAELKAASEKLGLPLVLKTSRGGYDGKGQFVVKTEADITEAWKALGDAVSGKGQSYPYSSPFDR